LVVEVIASFVLNIASGQSWSDSDAVEPDWEAAAALAVKNADLNAAMDVLPDLPALPEPPDECQPPVRRAPAAAERPPGLDATTLAPDPEAIKRCRAAKRAFYQRWGHLLRSRPRRFVELHRFLPGVDEPTTAVRD
jgi:hypothetical protein